MPHLLTLSRAARLVGVTRGALQNKIKAGELPTFEGMVKPADLLQAYPEAELEPDRELERVTEIKAKAFGRRIREHILPSAEVLAARLSELSGELVKANEAVRWYKSLVDELDGRLADLARGKQSDATGLRTWLRSELDAMLAASAAPHPLLIKDRYLRVMTAHVTVQPGGHDFFVEGADSILDAALRGGLTVDYGCSDGSCGRCRARLISGQVATIREHPYVLDDKALRAGELLLCSNTAVTDLVVEAPEADGPAEIPSQRITARVISIQKPVSDTVILELKTPASQRLRFLSGQYATVIAEGVAADCAIASCPCDDRYLQFHLDRERESQLFTVCEGIKPGDSVTVAGPVGDFVLRRGSTRSIIFLAMDSGFAPVKSLIEHAMAMEVAEHLHLYWFASAQRGHYLHNRCRAWTDALDDFRYTPLVVDERATGAQPRHGPVDVLLTRILKDHPDVDDFDVYAAGPTAFVEAARRLLSARGLPQEQLFTDVR
jgi:CDP-4-dehydro-6-deoxyglucose reductase